jgi:hypothetical protein
MIQAGRLDEAERNLVRAKILSPTSPEYTAAQSELIAVRDLAQQQVAAAEARNERVAALLRGAELSVQNGSLYLPRGNNALEKVRQVLELESDNQLALELRRDLNSKIETAAKADVEARRFDDAKMAIDALASNMADSGKIDALRGQLKAKQDEQKQALALAERQKKEALQKRGLERQAVEKTEQQRQVDQSKQRELQQEQVVAKSNEADKLLRQARVLGGPWKISSGNYRQLADIYVRVLAIEPKNSAASRGLSQVRDFTVGQAGQALYARNFRAASSYIDVVNEISPQSPQLPQLLKDLAKMQRQDEQVMEFLAAADALIAMPYKKPGFFGNNTKPRKTLRTAFSKIEAARKVDASSPTLAVSEQKLVKKYTDIINIHMNDNDLDEAREFIDDLAATGLAVSQVTTMHEKMDAMESEQKE